MRNGTKIRKLLMLNNILISEGVNMKVDIIVTNRDSGNSHMVTGDNWSDALNKAVRDTRRIAKNESFSF